LFSKKIHRIRQKEKPTKSEIKRDANHFVRFCNSQKSSENKKVLKRNGKRKTQLEEIIAEHKTGSNSKNKKPKPPFSAISHNAKKTRAQPAKSVSYNTKKA